MFITRPGCPHFSQNPLPRPSDPPLRFRAHPGPPLHAEILREVRGNSGRGWGEGGAARWDGWRGRGERGGQVSGCGDDLLFTVPSHFLFLPLHCFIDGLHRGLENNTIKKLEPDTVTLQNTHRKTQLEA